MSFSQGNMNIKWEYILRSRPYEYFKKLRLVCSTENWTPGICPHASIPSPLSVNSEPQGLCWEPGSNVSPTQNGQREAWLPSPAHWLTEGQKRQECSRPSSTGALGSLSSHRPGLVWEGAGQRMIIMKTSGQSGWTGLHTLKQTKSLNFLHPFLALLPKLKLNAS